MWPVALAVLLLALTFHTSLRDLLLHPLVDSAPSTHHATTRLAFRSRVLFAPPMHIPVMCKDLFLVLFWGRPRHDLSCASSLPAMYADHLHTLRAAAGARPSEVRRYRGEETERLNARSRLSARPTRSFGRPSEENESFACPPSVVLFHMFLRCCFPLHPLKRWARHAVH